MVWHRISRVTSACILDIGRHLDIFQWIHDLKLQSFALPNP